MKIASFTTKTSARVISGAIIGALFGNALPARAEWRHAHADSANTGFARIDTRPAARPTVALTGPLAPGANPVVGPDGTVYIGNLQGELRAFRANGTPYWTRALNPEHGGIFSSPVVGADGSVYVASTIHRAESPNQINESFLHKFTPGGGWLFARPFPKSGIYPFTDGGATNAALNIWRSEGTEAIIVPVVYRGLGRQDVSVVAFSTAGAVLGNQQVTVNPYEITGSVDFEAFLPYCLALNVWNLGYGCFIMAMITGDAFAEFGAPGPSVSLRGAGFPLPGVAIASQPGGAPLIVMTDRGHDKVVLSFSPATGFSKVVVSGNQAVRFVTPPVVQPNGNILVGTDTGTLTKMGPAFNELPARTGLGMLTAAPTALNDGTVVVVSRDGMVTRLTASPRAPAFQDMPGGPSIASAAASCTHIFVATTEALFSFDVKSMQRVATVPWTNGGLAAPVIGTSGQVYAVTTNVLYSFPGPPMGGVLGTTACDVLAPAP